MRWRMQSLLLTLAMFGTATGSCFADATLSIQFVGSSGPFPQGQLVQVKVRMTGIPAVTPAAGFQAFLQFDTTQLSFQNGAYTNVPFGLHLIDPISAVGNHIDLASGINAFIKQPPSSADADLAILTFQVTTPCGMGAVKFRSNQPPTRLTDEQGQPILPLALQDLAFLGPCPADMEVNGRVDVNDLLLVITHWGRCPSLPTCCPGDANGDHTVNVDDLLAVIVGWGLCP